MHESVGGLDPLSQYQTFRTVVVFFDVVTFFDFHSVKRYLFDYLIKGVTLYDEYLFSGEVSVNDLEFNTLLRVFTIIENTSHLGYWIMLSFHTC